jgi:hypothetical protein
MAVTLPGRYLDRMVLTVLAILVAVTFLGTGGVKLLSAPASLKIRDSLDVDPGQWRLIGVLEWLGVAGVLAGLAWWPIGLAACVGLVALLAGAVYTRVGAARRHSRSEAVNIGADILTLAVVVATAIAFVTQG